MNIPFHKAHIGQEEVDSICKTLESGWLTMGPKTIEFENSFKDYIGSDFAISVSSATAALHLALNAINIKKDDEVIIPTNTFISTSEVVMYLGANPILCDIKNTDHNIDETLIPNLITPKTKAIIPVHFAGNPCNMDEICKIAESYNLRIIEDAAHALPSIYKDQMIGTVSDATCFSFYATKTLTTGEGGMVTTNNLEIANKIRLQRLHGISGDAWNRYSKKNDWYYEVVDLGYKYNTTDLQASIGLVQLKKLEWMKEKRKKIAQKYIESFSGKIDFVKSLSNNQSSWHLFVIKIANRDQLYQKLQDAGISTSVHFIPIHHHPYYKKIFGSDDSLYPIANNIYNKSLSLPIYPSLTEEEVDYIIKNVIKYAQN